MGQLRSGSSVVLCGLMAVVALTAVTRCELVGVVALIVGGGSVLAALVAQVEEGSSVDVGSSVVVLPSLPECDLAQP